MLKDLEKREAVIKISGLTKTYPGSKIPALNNLSIEIYAGEVYGFLGPNGAGKSTAIRTLMNLIQPTKGSATICGFDIVKDSLEVRKSLGYLPGDFTMYPKMTGRQFLNYMCELQGGTGESNIHALAKRLKADLHKKLGELSRGNRQKIGLIQVFMHQPKAIVLDEPTSGLDPLMQETFYELVNEAKARGAAIFMSSHVLSEVQKVCDRVGIIRDGKLISEKNIAEMATEAAQTFDIQFLGQLPIAELKKLKGTKITNVDGRKVVIHIHGRLSELFAILAKHEVLSINARNLDLEESFMHFYTDKDTK